MKTIIAGSRSISSVIQVEQAIFDSGFKITEVVCGMAPGVDMVGERWARKNKIPVKRMPADWRNLEALGAVIKTRPDGTKYNARAGHDRNRRMAEYADALIVIWDGHSRGTANMIEIARELGLKVFVRIVQ